MTQQEEIFNKLIMTRLWVVRQSIHKHHFKKENKISFEDIQQECLLKLWSEIDYLQEKPEELLNGYIRTICRNVIIKLWEKDASFGLVAIHGEKKELINYHYAEADEYDINAISGDINEITAYNVPEEDYLSYCSDTVKNALSKLTDVQRNTFLKIQFGYSFEELQNETYCISDLIKEYTSAISVLRKNLKKYYEFKKHI